MFSGVRCYGVFCVDMMAGGLQWIDLLCESSGRFLGFFLLMLVVLYVLVYALPGWFMFKSTRTGTLLQST